LATPKTDIEQSVGRILRQKREDRANTPLVIDIVDTFSMFPRQAAKRAKYYKKLGFDIGKSSGSEEDEEPCIVVDECSFIEDA
jgi:hypothetical protein